MKIPDSSQSALGDVQYSGTGSVKGAGSTGFPSYASSASTTSSDAVELSGVSQLLQAGSTQRAQQIRSLSNEVRSSQYSVPSLSIGRSLIGETLARSSG